MSIDKFGRYHAALRGGRQGPPGLGFTLSNDGHFDIRNKRLANVADPVNESDVITLKHYLNTKYDFDLKRLVNLAGPQSDTDGVNKMYVDHACRSACGHTLNRLHADVNSKITMYAIANCLHRNGQEFVASNKRIIQLKEPQENNDAVTKLYVDKLLDNLDSRVTYAIEAIPRIIENKIARCLMLDEAGNYDVKKAKIINVPDPVNASEAVNKLYVDGIKGVLNERLQAHVDNANNNLKEAKIIVQKVADFQKEAVTRIIILEDEMSILKGIKKNVIDKNNIENGAGDTRASQTG